MAVAQRGIDELRQYTDSLILIPNEKLSLVLGKKVTLLNCFKAANDVLQNAVQGISDLITRPGLINVDFADVKTVMSKRGMSMMGRSEEHTSELQSLMRISYAVFCLKNKIQINKHKTINRQTIYN